MPGGSPSQILHDDRGRRVRPYCARMWPSARAREDFPDEVLNGVRMRLGYPRSRVYAWGLAGAVALCGAVISAFILAHSTGVTEARWWALAFAATSLAVWFVYRRSLPVVEMDRFRSAMLDEGRRRRARGGLVCLRPQPAEFPGRGGTRGRARDSGTAPSACRSGGRILRR